LGLAISEVRSEHALRRGLAENPFQQDAIVRANEVYKQLDLKSVGVLPIYSVLDVFLELGLEIGYSTVDSVVQQLDMGDQLDVTFHELLDIAVYIAHNL